MAKPGAARARVAHNFFGVKENFFGGHGIGAQIGTGVTDLCREIPHLNNVVFCFWRCAARQGMPHETFNMATSATAGGFHL